MAKKLATRLGECARAARQRLNLTQEDVAERIGIATEVYGRLERGNMLPSVPTFRGDTVPVELPAGTDLQAMDGAMRVDKKRAKGITRFVLPRAIGEVELGVEVGDWRDVIRDWRSVTRDR